MIKLNDYLGSIVASFTNAKIMSDLQTVKLAEAYAKHDYLKHFSIPRMRIDDVEMTIPIALEDVEVVTNPDVINFDAIKMNSLVYAFLIQNFSISKISKETASIVKNEITKQVILLENEIKSANINNKVNDFSKVIIMDFIKIAEKYALLNKELLAQIDYELIIKKLINAVISELGIKTGNDTVANLNIIVEANRLREIKSENLIFIKLKISEDGMEWSRSENSKGEIESKLLPE